MFIYNSNYSNKTQSDKLTLLVNQIAQKTGIQPKIYGNGFRMRCPAHDDRNPSFIISEGQDGKILMKCFRGCHIDEMCQALNITKRYLFPSKTTR